MSVVTRFPPSPTGQLHIGSARTALFNWLFARANKGTFLLRIEDTDVERSRDEYTQAIIEAMKWLGLDWDGEIVHQSRRREVHLAAARAMLDRGDAYRCFCTAETLDAKRKAMQAAGQSYRYDRTCAGIGREESDRRAAAGEKFTIRVRKPEAGLTYRDELHGEIALRPEDLDDIIIVKSDGLPLYHLAVVCDDADSGVTHIIRGDDHLSNTPKQIQIYQALGKPVPAYVHIPLILGADRKRLSKREGATSVLDYRDQGYLPDAFLNFLALMGWSHPDGRDVLTVRELIEGFSPDRLGKSGAVFDPMKLRHLNGKHLHGLPADEKRAQIELHLRARGEAAPARLGEFLAVNGERGDTAPEVADQIRFFWARPHSYEESAAKKFLAGKGELLCAIRDLMATQGSIQAGTLEQSFRSFAEARGVKFKDVGQAIRVMLCGKSVSPPIFESIELLGNEETLSRMDAAIAAFGAN